MNVSPFTTNIISFPVYVFFKHAVVNCCWSQVIFGIFSPLFSVMMGVVGLIQKLFKIKTLRSHCISTESNLEEAGGQMSILPS